MRRFIYNAFVLLFLVSCTSQADKFEAAFMEGNLSEAETILKDVKAEDGKYRLARMLIDEYLSLDELDKAINVYERITPYHCSRY